MARPTDLVTLADRLRWCLETADLSAVRLSMKAGLGSGHVATMLRKREPGDPPYQPRIQTVTKIAGVLGADPLWLAHGVGSAPSARRLREVGERLRPAHAA